jgi:hypothetical protein
MRSAVIRLATSLEAREALIATVCICAALGAWLVTRSPGAAHASLVALRIVVGYCLSTG